jgi:hypothetical protein
MSDSTVRISVTSHGFALNDFDQIKSAILKQIFLVLLLPKNEKISCEIHRKKCYSWWHSCLQISTNNVVFWILTKKRQQIVKATEMKFLTYLAGYIGPITRPN